MSETTLAATLESLNKEQVTKAFVNKTAVSIPADVFGGQVMSATSSYYLDDKGNVKGKLSIKPSNGPQTDTGVYSIDKNGDLYVTGKIGMAAKKFAFGYSILKTLI